MQPESEVFEHKSSFEWSSAGKQFDILKTIVAFANCEGGTILIDEFIGDEKRLDSARLDDFIAKYVDPPVRGIASEKQADGSWRIVVAKSSFAPHVIKESGDYVKNGKQKPAFYPGQVFVRHSSKSEPASALDFQRLIREGVASWLSSLGDAVGRVGLSNAETGTGVPMRLVEGGPALEVSVSESHPYSASDLGVAFGKKGSWIGKLINREKMREDPVYCKRLDMYSHPVYVFSEAAKSKVASILTANPDYNPYKKP